MAEPGDTDLGRVKAERLLPRGGQHLKMADRHGQSLLIARLVFRRTGLPETPSPESGCGQTGLRIGPRTVEAFQALDRDDNLVRFTSADVARERPRWRTVRTV